VVLRAVLLEAGGCSEDAEDEVTWDRGYCMRQERTSFESSVTNPWYVSLYGNSVHTPWYGLQCSSRSGGSESPKHNMHSIQVSQQGVIYPK
jgi:hypothetical protein